MIKTFEQAVQFLTELQHFGIKMGLEQTRRLAELCGNPDQTLRFIHLAGTNGKGSTGAMLERCLRESGFTSGFYSSPHLLTPCERIRINGRAVSEEEFAEAAEIVARAAGVMQRKSAMPTYFEAMTVMAMLLFKKHDCSYVVWETGMGGRLDSTNIVTPQISVITNIALDHEKFLGSTLAAIAGEKAGIIKPGVPVVAGIMAPEADAVLARRAAELSAPYIRAGEICPVTTNEVPEMRLNHQQFYCAGELIELQLNGLMQQRNTQVVIAVLKTLGLWSDTCRKALRNTRWPGRIQVLNEGRFILDGGHNPDGLQSLAETLKKLYPQQRFRWIFGAFADKDFSGGLQIIAPLVQEIHAVAFAEDARLSATPEAIAETAGKLNIKNVYPVQDLPALLKKIAGEKIPEVPVIIAGSLYLAGEVLEVLAAGNEVLEL